MVLYKYSKWARYRVSYVIQPGPWPEHRRRFLFMASVLLPVPLFFVYSFPADSENNQCSPTACVFSTMTQKTEAFSFSSHFLNLLCINKKTVRNTLQLALPQMHSSIESTQRWASLLQVGNLMPPLTTSIYLKLIARSGKLSAFCIEFMIIQILKMMDCVAVTATSKPEMEQGFSEPKTRALEKAGADRMLKKTWSWYTFSSRWQKILFRHLRSILMH